MSDVDLQGLLEEIKEHKKSMLITENSSEAEKLCYRLHTKINSKEELFQLREDLHNFYKSDAPESDKRMLMGYGEMLYMLCSAVEDYNMEI